MVLVNNASGDELGRAIVRYLSDLPVRGKVKERNQ